MFGDKFPVTFAKRAVAFVFPKNGLGPGQGLPGKSGGQADALHRVNGMTRIGFGIAGSGEIHAGRHQINEMGGVVDKGTFGCRAAVPKDPFPDAPGPVSHEGA